MNEGGDLITRTPEMEEQLQKCIEYESTNFQWVKVIMNWGILIILIIISLLRGHGPTENIIGVLRCDGVDWALFVILHIVCIIFVGLGINIVKREHKVKVECGYEFTEGDFEVTKPNVIRLMTVGFLGSIASAFCGVGTGFIFGPVLIMVGMQPQVATGTGMYMTMFTTLASTITNLI